MIGNFERTIAAGAILFGLGCSSASAQTAGEGQLVPANIEVPAGYSMYLSARAAGTQNYICLPAGGGVAWKFVGPQATLFQVVGGEIGQQVATHFLSANAIEDGLPRPTWQHSFDSSRVWARAVAASTDPAFVEAGAIPWLLLAAVGVADGPQGGSVLTQTAYIQRVNTSGGAAPVTGCSKRGDVGALVLVPYAADYLFYRAAPTP